MADTKDIDPASLKKYEHAVAGHEGVLSDASDELFIKPCTAAEIDFYQTSLAEHPDFADMMPAFLGTLSLSAPDETLNAAAAAAVSETPESSTTPQGSHGKKIPSTTAIVLENLAHNFHHANILDLKLGARMCAPDTPADKAARLDKVAAESTSASLHFRIAGMEVWTGEQYDRYDKFYGRRFTAENVGDGFATFFAGLRASVGVEDARHLLETMLAEVTKIRHMLEKDESRIFSASLLVVYEGDGEALNALMVADRKTPMVDEKAPTQRELNQSYEEEEEEDEDEPPVAFKIRMIDFAHARWAPGEGRDENVIQGLENIEEQMDRLIARVD